MFIGAPSAGKRTAIFYSIIISCQRRGTDPRQYLEDVLEQLPRLENRDCSHLTPANWNAQKVKEQKQAVV